MSNVFDASVVLALMRDEVAASDFAPLLRDTWVSSVNLVEVLSKVHELGFDELPRAEALLRLLAGVQPFTERQARTAASLRIATRAAGLSLGDRACIALAMEFDADVYTADRVWATLGLPCRIHLIR